MFFPGGGVSTKSSPGPIPAAFSSQLAYRATMKGMLAQIQRKVQKKFGVQGSSDEADNCSLPDRRTHSMPENDQHTGMRPTEGEVQRQHFRAKLIKSANFKTI